MPHMSFLYWREVDKWIGACRPALLAPLVAGLVRDNLWAARELLPPNAAMSHEIEVADEDPESWLWAG